MIDIVEVDFRSCRGFGLNAIFDEQSRTLLIDCFRDKSKPLTPVRFVDFEAAVQQAEVARSIHIPCYPLAHFLRPEVKIDVQ